TGAKLSRAQEEARALGAQHDALAGSPLIRQRWEGYGYGDLGKHAPCFAPGTVVLTPAGPRPIEEIAVGQRVLSYDFGAGRVVESAVTATSRGWTRHLAHVAVDGCQVSA